MTRMRAHRKRSGQWLESADSAMSSKWSSCWGSFGSWSWLDTQRAWERLGSLCGSVTSRPLAFYFLSPWESSLSLLFCIQPKGRLRDLPSAVSHMPGGGLQWVSVANKLNIILQLLTHTPHLRLPPEPAVQMAQDQHGPQKFSSSCLGTHRLCRQVKGILTTVTLAVRKWEASASYNISVARVCVQLATESLNSLDN